MMYPVEPSYEMTRAGAPTTTASSGTSWQTTEFDPIATLLPMRTAPKILVPGPMKTLSPMIGVPLRLPRLVSPIITSRDTLQFSSNDDVSVNEHSAEVIHVHPRADICYVRNVDAELVAVVTTNHFRNWIERIFQ
jgi:hypothetical protein